MRRERLTGAMHNHLFNKCRELIHSTNIHLIGLGGIGCAYAARAQDHGHMMKIICDPERKTKYSQRPFSVNGKPYTFDYISGKPKLYPKLLLISTKYNDLEAAIEQIREFIHSDTIIISLLNGINSEEIIREKLRHQKIVHAYSIGTDAKKVGHDVSFTRYGEIVVGSPDDSRTDLVQEAKNILRAAGIDVRVSESIIRELWWKFMVNIGINQISALHKITYKEFNNPHIEAITRSAMNEVVLIANHLGIDLGAEDINVIFERSKTWGPMSKSSMLQDLDRGRHTEVEMLAGELCRLGSLHNIPTPINQFLLDSIRYMEGRE